MAAAAAVLWPLFAISLGALAAEVLAGYLLGETAAIGCVEEKCCAGGGHKEGRRRLTARMVIRAGWDLNMFASYLLLRIERTRSDSATSRMSQGAK